MKTDVKVQTRPLTEGEYSSLVEASETVDWAIRRLYETLSECGLVQQISTARLTDASDVVAEAIEELDRTNPRIRVLKGAMNHYG